MPQTSHCFRGRCPSQRWPDVGMLARGRASVGRRKTYGSEQLHQILVADFGEVPLESQQSHLEAVICIRPGDYRDLDTLDRIAAAGDLGSVSSTERCVPRE